MLAERRRPFIQHPFPGSDISTPPIPENEGIQDASLAPRFQLLSTAAAQKNQFHRNGTGYKNPFEEVLAYSPLQTRHV
jgi:hypothetical protein